MSKCKSRWKQNLKFGNKNNLFGYFFHCNFERLLSYLKLKSSNLSKCKNKKASNLEPKMPWFKIFGLSFFTFEFVKNEFLANPVNLEIESRFSEGPGSSFLKVLVRVRNQFIKYAIKNIISLGFLFKDSTKFVSFPILILM